MFTIPYISKAASKRVQSNLFELPSESSIAISNRKGSTFSGKIQILSHFSLMVMADALEHGSEFRPFLVFETEDDEQALGDLESPMHILVMTATYPEVVARDVVKALG